jgi:hypothetical protein
VGDSLYAYVPLLIHIVVALPLAAALILVSSFIGWCVGPDDRTQRFARRCTQVRDGHTLKL